MRYAYKDLGEQREGTTVVVQLHGSSANVLLLDPDNFSRYQASQGFRYTGGLFGSSPARLTVPRDDHWHLVVDLGGHRGRVRAHVQQIIPPGGEKSGEAADRNQELETVN